MVVKIIKDSISQDGKRLTTFHLRYWRAIHSELMTHRVFSRNARSSRAVPSRVLLTEPMFTPQFGMNKPGMQSDGQPLMPGLQERWEKEWQALADMCRLQVGKWQAEGMHKQWANRPLEWFGWIDVLVSSTSWENFWALRISEFAQPEFDELARSMKTAMDNSTPQLLQRHQWHLPYVDHEEIAFHGNIELCQKLSVARCARLSYRPFDGQDTLEAEVARYEKLVVSSPVHASPAEHQATPDTQYYIQDVGGLDNSDRKLWRKPELHGNFEGWIQYRKTLANEAVKG